MYTQPYPEDGQGPAQKQNPVTPNSLLVADCGAVPHPVPVAPETRVLARLPVGSTARRDHCIGAPSAHKNAPDQRMPPAPCGENARDSRRNRPLSDAVLASACVG